MPEIPTKNDLRNQAVLLRLDLDLPFKNGQITDDTRLKLALPTLEFCLKNARKTLILGHLGRPSGVDPKFSLKPVAETIKELLHQDIPLFHDFHEVGEWGSLPGNLGMLENLRFWPSETNNEEDFIINLSHLGDVFINDSFATSHREVASITGIPKHLKSYIGFNFNREITALDPIINNPKHPIILILGGIKADKLEFVDNFLTHFDQVLLGGSLVNQIEDKNKLIKADLTSDGLDITVNSAQHFSRLIATASTIVWNGPVGKFENPSTRQGTQIIAKAITSSPAYKIAGGGDTLSAIKELDLSDKFDYLSSGGGALLYYLAHHSLPGLVAIKNSPKT